MNKFGGVMDKNEHINGVKTSINQNCFNRFSTFFFYRVEKNRENLNSVNIIVRNKFS